MTPTATAASSARRERAGDERTTGDRIVERARLMSEAGSRRVQVAVMLFLAAMQLLLLVSIGNGLARWGQGDPFSEADAVRSAQYYVEHGLTSNAGLPKIAYGERFADEGFLGVLRGSPGLSGDEVAVPNGVYTRYPPLPNWLCAISERLFGFENLWAWRLLPLTVGLVSFAAFLRLLTAGLGSDRAAVIGVACAVLPMTSSHMAGLHYEGYAQSLFLVQVGLLVRDLWRGDGIRPRTLGWLAALCFIQGYLSFDYAFVVTFAAVPLWFLRRADGGRVSFSSLAAPVLVCGAAFTLAHVVHFGQVVAYYDGLRPAIDDYVRRAEYRAVGAKIDAPDSGYGMELARALVLTAAVSLHPANHHFGPWLAVALLPAVAMCCLTNVRVRARSEHGASTLGWGNARRYGPGIAAALAVSALWYAAMPNMTVIHTHVLPRLLFTGYVGAVLAIVLAVRLEPVASHERA